MKLITLPSIPSNSGITNDALELLLLREQMAMLMECLTWTESVWDAEGPSAGPLRGSMVYCWLRFGPSAGAYTRETWLL